MSTGRSAVAGGDRRRASSYDVPAGIGAAMLHHAMALQPGSRIGIMSLNLSMLVTTPDGRGYGYTWHRATSDLFLVRGWS